MEAIDAETLTRAQVNELQTRGASFEKDGFYNRRCSICNVPVHFVNGEWQAEPNRVNHYTNVCPRGDTPTGWGSHYVNTDF